MNSKELKYYRTKKTSPSSGIVVTGAKSFPDSGAELAGHFTALEAARNKIGIVTSWCTPCGAGANLADSFILLLRRGVDGQAGGSHREACTESFLTEKLRQLGSASWLAPIPGSGGSSPLPGAMCCPTCRRTRDAGCQTLCAWYGFAEVCWENGGCEKYGESHKTHPLFPNVPDRLIWDGGQIPLC